jgi:hypothetical protein
MVAVRQKRRSVALDEEGSDRTVPGVEREREVSRKVAAELQGPFYACLR